MRLIALLVAMVVVSALGVVRFTHEARNVVKAQEREQARTRALETEWSQLQIENGTWAAPARIEKIARERLAMGMPARDHLVALEPLPAGVAR